MSWQHGVFIGASLESETTAAALGKEGEREHNPMANLDFLVIPLGEYIQNHLRFGNACAHPPRIFSTNYYLSENGAFLNGKMDKKVWLLWMEGRIHNEFSAIETPIGLIPKYDDCKQLFKNALNKEYGMEDYSKQFSVRIDKHLNKLDRIEKIYREEENIPESFTHELNMQRQRLLRAREKWGKDVVSPFDFE